MAHAIAPDYGQQFIFPPALEDWVPADHPARFLREFVDQLDLAALGFVLPSATEGRPPYAPSLLLKIWLYGYFHRIRSTRKLEAACREHLSLVWLTGMIYPDHNSLWRFWRDNRKALREIFKQTVQVAVRTGCVGLALQAVDGTKIAACASSPGGWSRKYMEKLLAALDETLAHTELTLLQEEPTQPGYRLPAGLAERQALREQIKTGLAQLAADQRGHYHRVEPEARRMQLDGKRPFAYNAQAVADQQAGIIVACEVTRQQIDVGQLVPMIEQVRENVGIAAHATVTVADTGYGAGADLQLASEKGLAVLAPPMEGSATADQPYATRHFHYDPAARTLTCPQNQKLAHEGHTTKADQRIERYRCHRQDCPVRAQCTRDPKGRQVEVRPWTPLVQAMRARLEQPSARALWRQRREIIERVFAQIKQHEGFRRWTVWGLDAVRTQWAVMCATLNLRVLYQAWRTTGQNRPGGVKSAAWQVRKRAEWLWLLRRTLQHALLRSNSWIHFYFGSSSGQPTSDC
jgi:transposase